MQLQPACAIAAALAATVSDSPGASEVGAAYGPMSPYGPPACEPPGGRAAITAVCTSMRSADVFVYVTVPVSVWPGAALPALSASAVVVCRPSAMLALLRDVCGDAQAARNKRRCLCMRSRIARTDPRVRAAVSPVVRTGSSQLGWEPRNHREHSVHAGSLRAPRQPRLPRGTSVAEVGCMRIATCLVVAACASPPTSSTHAKDLATPHALTQTPTMLHAGDT